MKKSLAILLLLSIAGISLDAQNMHISYYSEAKGLPSDQVRHVAYDQFGFLWIACDGGLLKFDGISFTDYSNQLPSQYGRYFCAIDKGLLLSHDAGISLIETHIDTAYISLFKESTIDPGNEGLYYPAQVFRQSNGQVWVSQPGGKITILSGEEEISIDPATGNINDKKLVAFFSELENGVMVMGLSGGELFVFDEAYREPKQVATLPHINDLKSRGNEIWAAGDHIYRIRLTDDHQKVQEQELFPASKGRVTALALDSRGNIFAGIENEGLYFLDRREGQSPDFIRIFSSNDPHRVDELPFRNIHQLVLETDNQLWVCSAEGMGILQRRFFESIGSIPNANTTSVCVAENGKIFVNFGDIYVIEETDFGYDGTLLPSFSQEPVTALTAAGNQLWAGTSTGNLIRVNQRGRKTGTVDLRPRGEGIYYLAFDSHDRLWVCQAPEERPVVGIGCILPDGTLVEYGHDRGLVSRVLCLRETARGRIYASAIGEGTYLYRYLPGEDAFVNLSLPFDFPVSPNFEVHDLAVDERGIVWLASTNGLLRYDMDRVRRVDLGDEHRNMEFRAVVDMPDGSIWVSTDTEGVIRYREGEPVIIAEESGLPSKVMTYRCLVRDADRHLWVGTAEGIVYSLDENPAPNISEPPLLTDARVDHTRVPVDDLSLFAGQSLALRIVSPSFHGYRTFYQYRMNGGSWSDPSETQRMFFNSLETGTHSLEFRTRNEGGFLWSEPLAVRVTVRDRWYKSSLFRGALAVAALIFITWLLLFWRRRYQRYIDKLATGLKQEQAALEKRDADLVQARKEVNLDQRQLRTHMISIEIMHRLIAKITPGMKWDSVMEIISVDLLKLPGVVAFEIGIHEGHHIEFEGYSELSRDFTSGQVLFDPETNLAAYSMKGTKPLIFNRLEEEAKRLLPAWDKRLDRFKSAVTVPFFLETKQAVFSIYSDRIDLFDEYALKAIAVFATYLEQIY